MGLELKNKRILAIGAHPDDIEIGCGGTLAKHIERGDHVTGLVLTNGEGGGPTPKVRMHEASMAAAVMGYNDLLYGRLSALKFSAVEQAHIMVIELAIEDSQPDILYCHNVHDRHQNHETAARCSLIAAREVQSVLSFELPSTLHGFNPSFYVEISETLETKLRAISEFKSQKEKRYMKSETIIGRASDWSVRANYGEYVEAFCVERMTA